jgi:hypothetical protein
MTAEHDSVTSAAWQWAPACVRKDPVVVRSISATRLSVLCPANAGRYFAAVAGNSDLVFKLVADDELVGVEL